MRPSEQSLASSPICPPSLLLEMRREHIGHLAVHPDLQGRGIGSKLLREICANLTLCGKSLALLGAKPWEMRCKDLKRFYRLRHGFKNLRISLSTSFIGLSASIIIHLPIEARESALSLVRFNSSKLSNISNLLRSFRILL